MNLLKKIKLKKFLNHAKECEPRETKYFEMIAKYYEKTAKKTEKNNLG